ncbi:serine/threonine-protein kinase pim-2-like [Synchiropus splendidus]|uniref:serine/threonine-protein kinase pim-2-like n=1 Tax=Synchiropus splendidus TaxID=270530 RepID=UPI00237DD92D|nr:serine/threonine-protein kinase pim-2-like [Synchiropus splendidus]
MGALLSRRHRNSLRHKKERFEGKYCQLELLKEGTRSSVYAGYKRANKTAVAIKRLPNFIHFRNTKVKHEEVNVLQRLSSGRRRTPGRNLFLSLLDYYDLGDELILVLESPVPSVNLRDYIVGRGALPEDEAKLLFMQLVQVALSLQMKGICHRNINSDNILIDTSTADVCLRLIGFGSACFTGVTNKHANYQGTPAYIPPEVFHCGIYQPGQITVWQMGVVLYEMIHGDMTFETLRFLNKQLKIDDRLSSGCKDVLHKCLAEEPEERLTLDQLNFHSWMA